jgi:lipid II:glycine glycyltransferase (peptidoglycan interpeptide bridge formation enzyme)
MKIVELNDSNQIEKFLTAAGAKFGSEFLLSREWAEMFKNISIHGLFDGDELLAIFNLSRRQFKFGFYWYSARGPIVLTRDREVWDFLTDYLQKTGAVFWRVEPMVIPDGLICKKTIDLQPKRSLILDLAQSEESLLQGMHQKTRYNIRLAEKKGLTFCEGKTTTDFDDFWRLMRQTGERDSFKVHNLEHYKILATANPDFIKLFLVKDGDKSLAAGLFSFYGNKVTYLHGSSDHKQRQLMSPYLLQWQVIKLARQSSFLYYDFFGIDEQKWPGVTRFKTGFGGREIAYAGTHDLVFKNFKYNLYLLLRKLRRFI